MLTLLKNIECFCPRHCGKKDILIASDKICKITPPDELYEPKLIENIVSCKNLLGFPGLIDQHAHITGGGGEEGFQSRASEADARDILAAGVTTVVGLLGADGLTRSLENLYAKAKELEARGITTYIYSGSYTVPIVTFTGSIARDLVLIDKVIGAGEIAISDHRSSCPDLNEMLRLASEAHLGGLLSGKAGILHLHVGDGRAGLGLLRRMVRESDLSTDQFMPTHLNRNPSLFHEGLDYCRSGGNIDLTAGETAGVPVPEAILQILAEGVDLKSVTISSDSYGSIPSGGIAKIRVLYDDLRSCILDRHLSPETVFPLATENVSRRLRLYPAKGVLREGSDADILITDRQYNIQMLFCRGKLLYNNASAAGR